MDAALQAAISKGTALKKTRTNDRSEVRGGGGVIGKPGEKPAPEKADESAPGGIRSNYKYVIFRQSLMLSKGWYVLRGEYGRLSTD